ncbi:MAG TPA: carboxypeptidase-like regulatory domain-containing protein [Alphaproteobacteria bacterium]|nr:carboxypeptidase-like regulatory domain-containing protein [Alphaproteobacteria bacterium]
MALRAIIGLLASVSIVGLAGSSASGAASGVQIVGDDIGGVVKSSKGPEAGVWVIAETHDLKSPLIKIVVTDDQGRYVLPELPNAKYQVWVRGYGLVDSKPVEATPGHKIDLTAIIAPDAKAAAEIYPANYWWSLLRPPPANKFPGTGAQGNGIALTMKTQQDWLGHMKENCQFCHQLGTAATRELPGAANSIEGWAERIQKVRVGDISLGDHAKDLGAQMQNNMARFGRERGLKMYADWGDRIAAGETPPMPPRPKGVERNVVITEWDFAGGHFVHDEATTDKRNPTVNAHGPIYGTDLHVGHLEALDPATGATTEIDIPGVSPPVEHRPGAMVHNPMVDDKGRVWMSMREGEGKAYDWCSDGNQSKFAAYFPNVGRQGKEIALYDPSAKKVDIIPVCFDSHHVNFGHTKDDIVYFSGDFNVLGWINTKVWDETHDAKKAVGWCPFVLDTSGDGKIDPNRANWNQPADPLAAAGGAEGSASPAGADSQAKADTHEAAEDTRIAGFPYGMNVSPVDDSIWVAKYTPTVPSGLIRLEPGRNPPETCKTEYYEPPKLANGNYAAFNAREVDIDSKGIAWVAFGSGQLGRFDRSRCAVKAGPTATGQQCPEGWTFYQAPEPKLTGTNVGSGWYYLTWVDLHNVFGLGKDVPFMPGSNSDSILAFLPDSRKWVEMRVPYPLSFYPRGMDARIDDPKAGWKGREIWSVNATATPWHQETGEGSFEKVVEFQLRPDPLAH